METQTENQIDDQNGNKSKPLLANRLSFYTRPFKMYEYGRRVYDAKDNFVFQFEYGVYKELQQEVLFSLNDLDCEPINTLKLSLHSDIEIFNENKEFICIRGWGNLTRIGGYNFDAEKASKIQNDFRDWIIYKISTQTKS